MSPVFKITPTTQKYDWGKKGRSSSVALYAEASRVAGFVIDEETPYAELWMGTHPTSPSLLTPSSSTLSSHLASNPTLIGSKTLSRFPDARTGNLPFLFKVLSIHKALSIQTHPDKETAEVLHKERPDVYKDPNHKPEMALALTPFHALCGFRPLPEIASFLQNTSELQALIPPPTLSTFLEVADSPTPEGPREKAALKGVFASLMTASPASVSTQLKALIRRYHTEVEEAATEDLKKLVLRLDAQFPGDVGVFCVFMLNYVVLQPGEAIYLGAGEPHAYVSGECMECMANSDNVIRAGLTPKLRDVPNLVAGLTYAAAPPSKHVVKPEVFSRSSSAPSSSESHTQCPPKSTLYDPPVPEFSVVRVVLPREGGRETHAPLEGPSLIIVTHLSGLPSSTPAPASPSPSPGSSASTPNSGSERSLKKGKLTLHYTPPRDGRKEGKQPVERDTLEVGLGDVVFVGAGVGVEFVLGFEGERMEGGEEGAVLYRAFVEP